MEEIILHLIENEAKSYFELFDVDYDLLDECPEGLVGEIADDGDVEFDLYSDLYRMPPRDVSDFDAWTEERFYLDR
jgi:hypothetical protein